jgi:hypothetical protein
MFFVTKIVRKSKDILCSKNFPPKIVLFLRQCENYDTVREAKVDNKIRRRRDAICQIAIRRLQTHTYNIPIVVKHTYNIPIVVKHTYNIPIVVKHTYNIPIVVKHL